MAQKTEKEETEFKSVPEPITPCITNCGVTGNPSTNNMCQNCFTKLAPSVPLTSSSSASTIQQQKVRSPRSSSPRSSPVVRLPEPPTEKRNLDDEGNSSLPKKRAVNRCSCCSKKVGLTGIRCRCGELFCAGHRYSDRHDCSYDYKAAGREAITRENPVVKAAKIVKI